MENKNLPNVRFRQLRDTLANWITNDPVILQGELVIISDSKRIKLGTGDTFSSTETFGLDRWNIDITDLPTANDLNIKPVNSKRKNVEDFLSINGEIVYPINLTTSVKLTDGSNLQTWMTNIDNGNVTVAKLKTARNISIGNRSQPFDGSANIAYSLADIGAAESNHTHSTLEGIDITGATINVNDLNNSEGPKTVLYIVKTNAGSNNITNIPVTGVGFTLVVESLAWRVSTDWATKQTFTSPNTKTSYERYGGNGSWTAWQPVVRMTTTPVSGQVLISDGTPGGIKTSGYTIAANVPSNAKFTDTVYTHPNSGVTAGTYKSVTVNAQGHVTDGSNPTTLAGYGITDAASTIIYKSINIPTSGWNATSKRFEYANASITVNHTPDIRFSKDSLDAAGKAGIIVWTENGKLILECSTIPTTNLLIDVAILTLV